MLIMAVIITINVRAVLGRPSFCGLSIQMEVRVSSSNFNSNSNRPPLQHPVQVSPARHRQPQAAIIHSTLQLGVVNERKFLNGKAATVDAGVAIGHRPRAAGHRQWRTRAL